jgi:hypothetical protein
MLVSNTRKSAVSRPISEMLDALLIYCAQIVVIRSPLVPLMSARQIATCHVPGILRSTAVQVIYSTSIGVVPNLPLVPSLYQVLETGLHLGATGGKCICCKCLLILIIIFFVAIPLPLGLCHTALALPGALPSRAALLRVTVLGTHWQAWNTPINAVSTVILFGIGRANPES